MEGRNKRGEGAVITNVAAAVKLKPVGP